MKLSVIIPTKDRREIFARTLQAVIDSTRHIDAEIIVVNDSMSDVPRVPSHVKLIQNEKTGVAAARNLGVQNSMGDLLLFLDNDIIVSSHSVDHVVKLHKEHAKICCNLNWEYTAETLEQIRQSPFGRFLVNHNMTSFKGWYNDPSWRDDSLFMSKAVASFHLSIERKYFELSGGYNEHFPLAGFEDYDFPVRLKKTGVEFYIDTRITVFHNEVDRLELDNWLLNQERRAVTRSKAVQLGYRELQLTFTFSKRMLLRLVLMMDHPLRFCFNHWPNINAFDALFFKALSILQAARIYRGYQNQ